MVKFIKYVPWSRRRGPFPGGSSVANTFLKYADDDAALDLYFGAFDLRWIDAGRPFYRLWPSLGDCVRGTKLEMPRRVLLRLPNAICVETVDRCILGATIDSDFFVLYRFQILDNEKVKVGCVGLPLGLAEGDADEPIKLTNDDTCDHDDDFRVLVTVALLKDNPEYAEQIVLKADEYRVKPENRASLADKARRRGVNGVDIGRHIESMPHFRRPHFAIRWKGHKPNLTPELVPVKGAVVARNKVTDVPTGYYGGKNE